MCGGWAGIILCAGGVACNSFSYIGNIACLVTSHWPTSDSSGVSSPGNPTESQHRRPVITDTWRMSKHQGRRVERAADRERARLADPTPPLQR